MATTYTLARLIGMFGLGAVLWCKVCAGAVLDRVTHVAAAAFVAAPSPPPAHVWGRARMLHPPTPCDVPPFSVGGPGVPYFVTDPVPTAGRAFHVHWSTKPTEPGSSPAWPAMLFVSFAQRSPMPLAALGAPGCHLQVDPDFVMVPTPGSILTQQGGQVQLDWTPPPSMVGETLYAQLFVQAPGVNAAGFLLSPALHVVIGN